ncbi:MAG TPA: hypothetical protein VJ552_05850 [Sediminibacterium sp.]|nr:hypothetical protein [Sediminibacterium sp.]
MNPAVTNALMTYAAARQNTRANPGTLQIGPRPASTAKKVVVGVLVGAGVILMGRLFYLKWRALQFQKRAYLPGSAEAFAQMIRLSIHNDNFMHWGTDNEALRKVFIAIPSKDFFRKVIDAYAGLYSNDSMMGDLKSELKTSEYKEMLAIISSKPDTGNTSMPVQLNETQYRSWADRIAAAFDYTNMVIFPGTDEDAIKQVLTEIPTQSAYATLGRYFQQWYGKTLEAALRDELYFWEYNEMMEIIKAKP